GAAYRKDPLPEDPARRISITWYEYLRALALKKPIRILVRQRIWDQREVFQAARKAGGETDLPAGLFDFLEFICRQERANWIHTFRDFPEAKKILSEWLRQEQAQNAGQFEREVRELLALQGHRRFESDPTGAPYFLTESGDAQVPIQWAVPRGSASLRSSLRTSKAPITTGRWWSPTPVSTRRSPLTSAPGPDWPAR